MYLLKELDRAEPLSSSTKESYLKDMKTFFRSKQVKLSPAVEVSVNGLIAQYLIEAKQDRKKGVSNAHMSIEGQDTLHIVNSALAEYGGGMRISSCT
jgi:hypothetical protein